MERRFCLANSNGLGLWKALILRGSRDFRSVEAYISFVRQVADKRNRLVGAKLEHERRCLRPLPPAPVPERLRQ